ncbi:MAG: hypothetical protein E7474_01350 [Ruminococcaceae bacterium]|nr:hypothetical protein [Oscillospiraceae bacterium]
MDREHRVLSDTELRARWRAGETECRVAPGTVVTPAARDFLREHGMTLREDGAPYERMTVTPIPLRGGKVVFQNAATGEETPVKGEGMTHLRGNLLVPKTDPRIALRGKLDTLSARFLRAQLAASEAGNEQLSADVGELLSYVRTILGCEVKDEPLPEPRLLGLDSAGIRRASHRVRETFGIDHPVPDYRMGSACLLLNELRAEVREAELAAARAFLNEDGTGERMDVIEGLNRLSSCVYILFCREVARGRGQEKKA